MGHVPSRRVLSGLFAGLVAGVALLLLLQATRAWAPIVAATPLQGAQDLAAAVLASSLVLGAGFALLPVTGPWQRGLAWGLGYGAATWLVLDHLVVHAWARRSLALDEAAMAALGGRLLWGAVLGVAFVGLMLALFHARQPRRAPAERSRRPSA